MNGGRRAAAWFLGGLLVGVLAAGAASRLGRAHRWESPRHERMLERFHRKLDLTPEQSGKVGAVLRAKKERMDALRAESTPKFEELRASTRREIAAILTPEQRTKFEALEKKWEARREKRRARGLDARADGPPPGAAPPPPPGE
jgi:Spy/CpxP family protein refolding chaperone